MNIFNESKALQDLKDHLIANKFLSETKRIRIEHFKVMSSLFTGKYSKYAKLEYKKAGSETQGICEYLNELKEHITSEKGEYVYEMNLPFGTKEEEAKKLWMFLKEKYIIKSGGLKLHKYGDIKNELEDKVSLKAIYSLQGVHVGKSN